MSGIFFASPVYMTNITYPCPDPTNANPPGSACLRADRLGTWMIFNSKRKILHNRRGGNARIYKRQEQTSF